METTRLAKTDKYKEEFFKLIVEKSLSYSNICRELNIRPNGGNFKTVKYYINLYNIDISHFTGQAWNVGTMYRPIKKPLLLSDILVENSTYTDTKSIKKRLLNNGILEYKCDECGIIEWNGKELSLHLDHINGNNRDNRLENLRLLCPNCHSQTETYGGKNCGNNSVDNVEEYRKELYEKYKNTISTDVSTYCECGKKINKKRKHCRECYSKKSEKINIKHINYCKCGQEIKKKSENCIKCSKEKQRKVKNRPTYEQLKKEIEETNYSAVGRKYNVSDVTIKKWIKCYEKELK